MTATPETIDRLAALRDLSLNEIEERLADIDGERASLSLLRRSLVAKDNARRRTQRRSVTNGGRDD